MPLLSFLEGDKDATAMLIYPTKVTQDCETRFPPRIHSNYQALAQDQKGALQQLLATCPGLEDVQVAAYDGDTPQEDRRGIRETASVIFTNFVSPLLQS